MDFFDLSKNNYGIDAKVNHKQGFYNSDSEDLNYDFLSSSELVDGANVNYFQLRVKNNSKSSIVLNSIQVLDFNVPNFEFREILENSWTQSGHSRFQKNISPTKFKKLINQRDNNPFSFRSEFGYVANSLVSEWYSQIVMEKISLFIGAVSISNAFTAVYVSKDEDKIRVRVCVHYDGIEILPNETIESEKIVLIESSKESASEIFAKILSQNYPLNKTLDVNTGVCCAYYSQGNNVNAEYVYSVLKRLKEYPKNNIKYIQIDSGYCEWGDWISESNKFPAGMRDVANEIITAGYEPGIWVAPFVATKNSNLFKQHRDWFVAEKGKIINVRESFPFEKILKKELYLLDIRKSEVLEYILNVFKTYSDFGFSIFKLDFLYPLCFTGLTTERKTRVQLFRDVLKIIRDAIGPDKIIHTAISQLSPVVGFADIVRTGPDTTIPMIYFIPFLSSLNSYLLNKNLINFESREFLNNKIWYADVDCLVTHLRSGLDKKLLDKHIDSILKCKSRWVGDNINKTTDINIDKIDKIL